jgi:hypothetical protein
MADRSIDKREQYVAFATHCRQLAKVAGDNQQRYRALRCLEHLDHIEAWRATLDEETKRRLSRGHPGTMCRNGSRSTEKSLNVQRLRPCRH